MRSNPASRWMPFATVLRVRDVHFLELGLGADIECTRRQACYGRDHVSRVHDDPAGTAQPPVVVISRIRIVSGNAAAVASQYRQRVGAVDDVPGFLGLEVLQPHDRATEFWIYYEVADHFRFRCVPAKQRVS